MGLVVQHAIAPAESLLAASDVLAVLEFRETGHANDSTTDPRHVVTGLPVLAGSAREVWRGAAPVECGREGPVRWANGGSALFAAVTADASAKQNLEAVTYRVWCRLLQFTRKMGFPHVVRAWNHVPRINEGAGDSERYRLFCAGRHRAFDDSGYGSRSYSAASAVGNLGDALVVYLLASREPGRHFENPRQLSAYSYPRQYGPRPPSFARATAKAWANAHHLYVSGTASILGHSSVAHGDVAGQLSVTFGNIDRLLSTVGVPDGSDRLHAMRVYVRDPANLRTIRAAVTDHAPGAEVAFLRADICRSELTLEIEGVSLVQPVAGDGSG